VGEKLLETAEALVHDRTREERGHNAISHTSEPGCQASSVM
jgi:hypothetical protein